MVAGTCGTSLEVQDMSRMAHHSAATLFCMQHCLAETILIPLQFELGAGAPGMCRASKNSTLQNVSEKHMLQSVHVIQSRTKTFPQAACTKQPRPRTTSLVTGNTQHLTEVAVVLLLMKRSKACCSLLNDIRPHPHPAGHVEHLPGIPLHIPEPVKHCNITWRPQISCTV